MAGRTWSGRMPSRIPFAPAEVRRIHTALASFSARDHALIVTGLNTGFRASELSAISIGHVWDGAAIRPAVTLERRSLKNGRGIRARAVRSRTVPLNATACEALQAYVNERIQLRGPPDPNESLFRSRRTGRGLSRWQINRLVHQVAEAAGLDPSGRYGGHSLRKSFANAVHRAGNFDINLTRAALGHRYVTTTQAYLEVDTGAVNSAVMAIGN